MGIMYMLCFTAFVCVGRKVNTGFSHNAKRTWNYSVKNIIGFNYAREGVCL